MIKLGLFFSLVLFSFGASAVDVSDIDKAIRNTKSKSIMFRRNQAERTEMEALKEQERKAEEEAKAKMKKEAPVFKQYNLFGNGLKIMATINGEMVSNKDLQERANLFSLTSGILINDKNKDMIINKVMQNVIDEKIKLQEADKMGVKVSDAEIKEAYRNFEKSNGVPSGKFLNVLKEYKVSKDVFMTQIKTNLLWNKLVANKASRSIGVSDRELDDEYKRIKKDMKTSKYMISEIVISRKDGKHIDELVEILQTDPRFELYAVQFSQSASAPSGGKLGWVVAGQLAKPLDDAIKNMKEGQVSKAIMYRNDYYILRLDKKYVPGKKEQELPTDDEVRAFIKNRKADELANKYIRDLRNRAIVEKKF